MYKMLAIGLSAGGTPLVKQLLAALPEDYPLAVVIVAHLPQDHDTNLAQMLGKVTALPVSIAKDKEPIMTGHVYIAPPGYHLLVEQDCPLAFALSEDEPVRSVRPSIDVLLTSAAEAFEAGLIAVVLSGANSDGADGMSVVKQLDGLCIVLNPPDAEFSTLPNAVIRQVDVDYIVNMEDMISLLVSVDEK
jgi:two-component system chemotaxis response regulator CheB